MNNVQREVIQFVVMFFVGISLNPMNVLAYSWKDLYISMTLIYGGILMASNMMWSHQIVHYFTMGHFNPIIAGVGVFLSLGTIFLLLRNQFMVDDIQWLKRMISHHSTAITTTENIYNKTTRPEIKRIAKKILDVQKHEIYEMKRNIRNIKKH